MPAAILTMANKPISSAAETTDKRFARGLSFGIGDSPISSGGTIILPPYGVEVIRGVEVGPRGDDSGAVVTTGDAGSSEVGGGGKVTALVGVSIVSTGCDVAVYVGVAVSWS